MRMRKDKKTILKVLLIFLLVGWMCYTNLSVGITRYEVAFEVLPESFAGFRIAQVSDFHNAGNDRSAERLSEKIKKENPDIIVLTGDLVDSNRTDVDVAINLVEKLVDIAPCYYVTGNHEAWLEPGKYEELESRMLACGVTVLRDEEVLLSRGGQQISLVGVDDPDLAIQTSRLVVASAPTLINQLSTEKSFAILLSHRPEYYEKYLESDVNLVLSGHAHGGQFRLPFVGGLVAPGQGMFPEYDSGVYREDDFAMVVSRGVGNSIIPVRFNNRPEVVVVELNLYEDEK